MHLLSGGDRTSLDIQRPADPLVIDLNSSGIITDGVTYIEAPPRLSAYTSLPSKHALDYCLASVI